MNSSRKKIRPMTEDDLMTVLNWRNHPEIRRYMYTLHEISLAEHVNWFEQSRQEEARHLLLYEENNLPLGFINLHVIADGGIANWGFYAAPYAPKGTGRCMGDAAIRYAFGSIGIRKICGQSLLFNERSIKFHLNLGFQQEGVLRSQHFDGQNYYDVLCFGLLAHEWPRI